MVGAEEEGVRRVLVPPDGGYGWVIVLACVLQQVQDVQVLIGLASGSGKLCFEASDHEHF